MNFQLFLEQYIEEASTAHGTIESILRGLKLKYKADRNSLGMAFYLDHGYIVISMNNGDIVLNKVGDSKALAKVKSHEVLNTSQILPKLSAMLKNNAKELFDSEKKKETA